MSRLWSQAADSVAPASPASPCEPRLAPMRPCDVDAVLAVEQRAYDFPWTRGNFADALAAGYPAQRLLDGADGRLLGYFVALRGAGEMHLLNLTVAPEQQGRGHARTLLEALIADCRAAGIRTLWLEVRAGNHRARALYARRGFVEVGLRPGYYPAAGRVPPREDAVLMTLDVEGAAP